MQLLYEIHDSSLHLLSADSEVAKGVQGEASLLSPFVAVGIDDSVSADEVIEEEVGGSAGEDVGLSEERLSDGVIAGEDDGGLVSVPEREETPELLSPATELRQWVGEVQLTHVAQQQLPRRTRRQAKAQPATVVLPPQNSHHLLSSTLSCP